MGVFSDEHQSAIDGINDDGWRYLAQRADEIAKSFEGKRASTGDTLYFQVNGIEAMIEKGEPNIEWSLPGEWNLPPQERRSFTNGFRLSVKANADSASNLVKCAPMDWYMLCMDLQIGLNMAFLDLATSKHNY